MKKNWIMFWLGVWLAGTVCVAVTAAENFYTIDRLLAGSKSAVFRSTVDQLGHTQARDLLRYLSSELNRLYFQLWNLAQLPIAVVLLWSTTRRPTEPRIKWGLAGMLGAVVLMTAWLAPEIVSVGRSLDFVARDPEPPLLRRFWILHGAYTTLDLIKLVV